MIRLARPPVLALFIACLASIIIGCRSVETAAPIAALPPGVEAIREPSPSRFPGNRRYHVPATDADIVVYREQGPADAQLTIVMLHGVANTKIMWKEGEARLHGYHTICVDLPGHGESTQDVSRLPDRADVPEGPYGLTEQGRFFRRFLSDLGLLERDRKVILAGCSYGGGIALEAYRLMSDDERAHVAGMFLTAPAAHACRKPERYWIGEVVAAFVSTWLGECVARLFVPATNDSAWTGLKLMYRDLSKVDEPLLDEWIADDLLMLQKPRAPYFVLRTTIDIWDELSIREKRGTDRNRYACVKCPVFVAWGTMDNVLDASILLQLKEEIPQLEYRLVHGATHDLLGLKDKSALLWLVEFVRRFNTADGSP